MSAEGKKKRGESGRSNAENIPFRYGGSKCNLSTKLGRSDRTGGSKMVRAIVASDVLSRIGYPVGYKITERMVRLFDNGLQRCTVHA